MADGGVRVVNQRCVRWDGVDFDHCKRTDSVAAARLPGDQWLVQGDILWNSTGTGTIGRAAIFDAPSGEQLVADSHVTVVRLRETDPRWVHHWISTHAVQQTVAGIGSTNQVELPRQKVMDLPVPCAPPEVQQMVLHRIDGLFAEIGDGERALGEARLGARTYHHSLIKAAVTGKLTDRWRARRPAPLGDGREQLLAQRRDRWSADPKNRKRRYVDPLPPNLGELPDLPKGWCWLSLDELAWSSQYGTSAKCTPEGGGEPVLRIPNLRAGRISLDELKCANAPLGISAADAVAPGDLLIVRTNGSAELIGRTGIADYPLSAHTYFASYLIRYRLVGDSVLWRWVRTFTESPVFRSWVLDSIGSSAGQYNLSMGKLDRFPIAVPPLDELEEVLRRVETETSLSLPDPDVAGLRQSVLASAFRGELLA